MKKLTTILAASVLAAISCNKVETSEPANVNEGSNLVPFCVEQASFPVPQPADQESRTAIASIDGSAVTVNWTADDNAILFDNTTGCTGHLFEGSVNPSNNNLISFSGEVDDNATSFCMVYPYNSGASLSDGEITTSLNATQTATVGTFADKTAISVARGTRTPGQESISGLTFNNACAVISFAMPSYVDGATSVEITSNSNADLAGDFKVAMADGSVSFVGGNKKVTLAGTLQAGARYFAVVAPGTYTNGFTFTVTTAGNNKYSTSSTRTIEATAGAIYNIGTLGLKLDATNITPSISIAPEWDENNVLIGSIATLSGINVPAELASMIESWNIELVRDSNNDVVRTYNTTSGTGSVANGYFYIPAGNYTVRGTYTLRDGAKAVVRNLPTNSTSTTTPDFTVTTTGYTSYDCYAGTNGQSQSPSTANTKDGSTIYGLSVTIGISRDLLDDPNGLYNPSWSYKYDSGSDTSFAFSGDENSRTYTYGDMASQSWGSHTWDAKCTFDGKTVDAEQLPLHVTGLPFVDNAPGRSDNIGHWHWNKIALSEYVSGSGNYLKIGGNLGNNTDLLWVETANAFYCPASINISFTSHGQLKGDSSIVAAANDLTITVGDITKPLSAKRTTKNFDYENVAGILASDSVLRFATTKGAGGHECYIYNASVTYR